MANIAGKRLLSGTAISPTARNRTRLLAIPGLRKGYSIYCPTCWTDCGKRATTDAEGK